MTTDEAAPDLILLRAARNPDPYVEAFAEVGLRAACRPVLTFTFPNDNALHARLQTSDAYSAVVATSPRAARALHRVFDDDSEVKAAWTGTRAYAVGPKTAGELQALSFDVEGEDSGTAADLAKLIVRSNPEKPLLFLSGNRRRDELPDALKAAGISFEEQVVYETHIRTDLTLPPPSDNVWLAFFSPSGLTAVQQANPDALDDYTCVAIGPTTASALEDAGGTPVSVADTPSPAGLVEAVVRARGRTLDE